VSKPSLIILGLLLLTVCGSTARSQRQLPNPVLVFNGSTQYELQGVKWTRYHFYIFNATDYPGALFAPAPELPPCGLNTKSSRTWIDLYEQNGKRIYGACAIYDTKGLSDIYFNLKEGTIPPSWIYVELNDRQTNTKYKSNLAETVL
jgi:hypothetical protein